MGKGCYGTNETLTQERREQITKILEDIEAGATITNACRSVKLSTRTFYNSINKFDDLAKRFFNRPGAGVGQCWRAKSKAYIKKETEDHGAEVAERMNRLKEAGKLLSKMSIKGINGKR